MSSEHIPSRLMKLPKLADLVARDLRVWIVRGTLKEGDQLPTLERLAARFGVSLAVIREAVRILETEDLLEIKRGAKGGVAVKTPSLEVVSRTVGAYLQFQKVTVDDLLTARMGVEPFAAARTALKPAAKIVNTLHAAIVRADACVADPLEFASATTAFHHAIVALTGNKTLSAVHAAMLNIVEAESVSYADRRGKAPFNLENRQTVVRTFYRLLNLIKAGDAAGAEQHWTRHLEVSTKVLLGLDHGNLIIDLFTSPDDAPPTVGLDGGLKSELRARAKPPKTARVPTGA